MTDDVDAFLARCEDVLTDWHSSGDSMHAIGYDVIDVDPCLPRYGFAADPPPAGPLPLRLGRDVITDGDVITVRWAGPTPATTRSMLRAAAVYQETDGPVVDSDGRAFAEVLQAAARDAAAALRPLLDACRHIGTALTWRPTDDPTDGDAPPTDPRERALHMRRNRNTGPHTHRLNGRRR